MEKLLAADAEAIAAANKKRAGAGDQSTADAEMIDPYLKRNPKSPIAGIQIYETPLARFLRTGTILRHVGKKVNVELDVGDEGSTDVSDEGNNKAGYGEPSIALRFTW